MNLLEPIRVGSLTLPNRIVMGSMHLGFEAEADAFPRLAAFYAERARGGAGLIVTGGVAPNPEGSFGPDGSVLDSKAHLPGHRLITEAVHAAGGRILMQVLHCGRYSRQAALVAPSPLKAPISPLIPRELSEADIRRTIADYAACAGLAKAAGYDGVEVMASEGYLINEFLAPRTNQRTDQWGGSLENRQRFALEIVKAVRAAVGPDFVLGVRMSMVDLVEDGNTAEEIVALAKALEAAGADLLNSGIGWHEARVPTIAAAVPPAAWSWATGRVKAAVSIPVVASNRINTPQAAEAVLAQGHADMVSMARPHLADPALAAKLAAGRPINVCIACNQGCLDAIFSGASATCLVNPRAGRELAFKAIPVAAPKRLAVVGGGPAGLACAVEAARRGHRVTLFEATPRLGGQFALAEFVPGKREYLETLRYFAAELAASGVEVRLNTKAEAALLAGFDEVVLATGIVPRPLDIPGAERAIGYEDILSGRVKAGSQVAIVGSGPIGFDVAAMLVGEGGDFLATWGVDRDFKTAGGLAAPAAPERPRRRVTMLQRRPGRPGGELGKTTGWIVKAALQRAGVEMLAGVTYLAIEDGGLRVSIGGEEKLVPADTVVACAGQEPRVEISGLSVPVHLIGGARDASRLDALRAFEEGTRLGLAI